MSSSYTDELKRSPTSDSQNNYKLAFAEYVKMTWMVPSPCNDAKTIDMTAHRAIKGMSGSCPLRSSSDVYRAWAQ